MNDQLFLLDLAPLPAAATEPEQGSPGAAKRSNTEDSNPAQIDTQSFKLLGAMLEMGGAPGMVQVMLEFAGVSLAQLRYFAGPLVLHGEMWADTLPNWIRKQVVIDRLAAIAKECEQGIVGRFATPAEVTAYLYCASLEAPLYSSLVDCRAWCDAQIVPKHFGYSEKQYWKALGCKPVTFKQVQYEFEDLAAKIRESVVKHATNAGIGKRPRKSRAAEEAIAVETESTTGVVAEQLGLLG